MDERSLGAKYASVTQEQEEEKRRTGAEDRDLLAGTCTQPSRL